MAHLRRQSIDCLYRRVFRDYIRERNDDVDGTPELRPDDDVDGTPELRPDDDVDGTPELRPDNDVDGTPELRPDMILSHTARF